MTVLATIANEMKNENPHDRTNAPRTNQCWKKVSCSSPLIVELVVTLLPWLALGRIVVLQYQNQIDTCSCCPEEMNVIYAVMLSESSRAGNGNFLAG